MVKSPDMVRHVVAWLSPVRWATVILVWAVVVTVWAVPHLNLPLRTMAPFGLTAVICRTLVAWLQLRGHFSPKSVVALSLSADALLLGPACSTSRVAHSTHSS